MASPESAASPDCANARGRAERVRQRFMATYAGLPVLALLLVWLTKRLWVVVVAVPPLVFALPAIINFPGVAFSRALLLAAAFVLFACARCIQGWWVGHTTSA